MKTVFLIPYRGDNGRRDMLWDYIHEHLQKHHPNIPIWLGAGLPGLFNRSAAINDAASAAGDWDMAVISDADSFAPPEQLEDAIDLAATTGRLTFAFTTVTELDETTSDHYLTGGYSDTDFPLCVEQIRRDELGTQSSLLAIPRTLWDKIGGMDEQFIGWGGEDNAFTKAATIIAGPPLRIDGTVYHLWHPKQCQARDLRYLANLRRWGLYSRATTKDDLERLRA